MQQEYIHPGRPALDRPEGSKTRLLKVHLTDTEWERLLASLPKDTRERGLHLLEFALTELLQEFE